MLWRHQHYSTDSKPSIIFRVAEQLIVRWGQISGIDQFKATIWLMKQDHFGQFPGRLKSNLSLVTQHVDILLSVDGGALLMLVNKCNVFCINKMCTSTYPQSKRAGVGGSLRYPMMPDSKWRSHHSYWVRKLASCACKNSDFHMLFYSEYSQRYHVIC